MSVSEINARVGSRGRRRWVGTLTLSSGLGTIEDVFSHVDHCTITEVVSARPSGDTYGYLFSSGNLIVASDNVTSTETVTVEVVGY